MARRSATWPRAPTAIASARASPRATCRARSRARARASRSTSWARCVPRPCGWSRCTIRRDCDCAAKALESCQAALQRAEHLLDERTRLPERILADLVLLVCDAAEQAIEGLRGHVVVEIRIR